MKKVYANLLGVWIDITHTGKIENCDPLTYIEDNLFYNDGDRIAECFKYDYINIQYSNADYRIHPSHIQIVHT